MDTMSTDTDTAANKRDHHAPGFITSASQDPASALPGNLPLHPAIVSDGRKQRRSSCRPTFVVPGHNQDDGRDEEDSVFQRDSAVISGGAGDDGKPTNDDARRRHSVGLLAR